MDLSLYAGRWVALVGGQVVAQALTARQARIAARTSRPRERCLILYVSDRVSDRPGFALPPIFDRVQALCPPDLPVWLVGGSVRDLLLNRPIHDLDFAVQAGRYPGDAAGLAREVADQLEGAFYPLDSRRGFGRVILPGDQTITLDFAGLQGPDLAADLKSRDFTLNALAISLHDPETLIDPLGGEADLRAGLLRACSRTAFEDDPARSLRAIRLAARFDFRLDRETRELARTAGPGLDRVSPERIRDEFLRMVGGRKPASAIRALDMLGLLEKIVPELSDLKGVTQSPPHTRDVWEHTLAVLERLPGLYAVLGPVHDQAASADLILGLAAMKLGRYRAPLNQHLAAPLAADRPARWMLNLAALLHDARKPQTRSVDPDGRIRFFDHDQQAARLAFNLATRLRLSTHEARRLETIVRHHMRPLLLMQQKSVSRRAIYRFFRDTGDAGVDICLLALADMLGTYGVTLPQDTWMKMLEVVAVLFDARFREPEKAISPPPLISGHDLLEAFKMESGPQIGELLEAVREAQAAGELEDREAALEFVRGRLGKPPAG